MKKSELSVRFNLLASGFLTSLTLYYFYISYRIRTFIPPPDPIGIIPVLSFWYNPELDLPLYLTGVVFVSLAGILIYFLLQKILAAHDRSVQSAASGFYLRISILLAVSFYVTAVMQHDWWMNHYINVLYGTVFFLITNAILAFVHPEKFITILRTGISIIDWLAITSGLVLCFRILGGVFLFREFTNGPLPDYLRENDYWAFPGFGIEEFVAVSGILLFIILLWLRKKRTNVRILQLTGPFIDYTVVAVIFYVLTTIVFIRRDDNIFLARYNLMAFIGPISEVLAGKSLLVDVTSQYGLGIIYFLAAIMSVLPHVYTSFFWITLIFTLVFFVLMYVSLRRWLGWWAIFTMILVLEHYHFANSTNRLFQMQQSLVRFGLWIPLFLFLCFKARIRFKPGITKIMELIIVGFAYFWAFDVGSYIILAYCTYRAFIVFSVSNSVIHRIKGLGVIALEVGSILGIYALVLSVITFFRADEFPRWLYYIDYVKYYTSGFNVYPMKLLGPYIYVLGVYSFVFILLLLKVLPRASKQSPKELYDHGLAAFICALGIAQFIYFTGHSLTNENLHMVIIPCLILTVWLIAQIPEFLEIVRPTFVEYRNRLLVYVSASVLFLCLTVVMTIGTANMVNLLKNRVDILYPWLDEGYKETDLDQTAQKLKIYLAKQNASLARTTIISDRTEYFLFMTGYGNSINYSVYGFLFTIPQLEELAHELARAAPKEFFFDHNPTYIPDYILKYVRDDYVPVENFGYLDRWEKKQRTL